MIKYTIIHQPDYTNVCKIGVLLEPDILPLKFFLSSMRLTSFPDLIKDINADRGYLGDPQGVFFYNDLDEEDFAEGNGFLKSQVKVYHHNFSDELIEKEIFIKKILR